MSIKNLTFTSLLISLTLTSCEHRPPSIVKDHYTYDDIRDFSITFNDIFTFDDPYYFIYIYSLNCLHCELIKDEVITYSKSDLVPMKFIEYYPEIPLLENTANTIGAKQVNEVGILGTPSLILIENKEVVINVSGMNYVENILQEYN